MFRKYRSYKRTYRRSSFAIYGTGGVSAEPSYSGTSWTALALEVGKSPTRPLLHGELSCPCSSDRRFASSSTDPFYEFTSSSSPSWSSNRAVLDMGANMVSRTRECAIDLLLVPALLALATPSIC